MLRGPRVGGVAHVQGRVLVVDRPGGLDRHVEDRPAAGAEHAEHLGHGAGVVAHVLQHVAAVDAAERAVRVGQGKQVEAFVDIRAQQIGADVAGGGEGAQAAHQARLRREMQDARRGRQAAQEQRREPVAFARAAAGAHGIAAAFPAGGAELAEGALANRAVPGAAGVEQRGGAVAQAAQPQFHALERQLDLTPHCVLPAAGCARGSRTCGSSAPPCGARRRRTSSRTAPARCCRCRRRSAGESAPSPSPRR